jgi:hypothetical protein
MKHNKKNSKSKNKKPKRKTRSFSKIKKSRMNTRKIHTKKIYQMVPIYGGFDANFTIGAMKHSKKITEEEERALYQLLYQKKITDMNSITEALEKMHNDEKTTNVNKTKSLPQASSTNLNNSGIQKKEYNNPSKKTLVKIIWLPKNYIHFLKEKLPPENVLQIGEHMIIVKDVYIDQYEKIMSDLNSVDNLLANLLNGCIGPKCKDGQVRPVVLLSKEIEVNYNKDSSGKLLAERDILEKELARITSSNT